jgi:hypothetical protein
VLATHGTTSTINLPASTPALNDPLAGSAPTRPAAYQFFRKIYKEQTRDAKKPIAVDTTVISEGVSRESKTTYT